MTAKEFFEEELSGEPLTQESVIEALKEFAKLHVKAALEAAANNAFKMSSTRATILKCYTDEHIS